MSYETVVGFTQPAALILFMALFVGIVVYAFWPGNKDRFDKAARLALKQDPDEPTRGDVNGDKS